MLQQTQRAKFIQSKAGNFNLGSYDDNGSQRVHMTVLNSGNVGIGTTSPAAKLEIKTDGETTNFIKLNSTKGTGNIYGLKTNGGNSDVLAIMDITAGNRLAAIGQSEISFATGGTTRLLMNSSGNVGIGTTSPSTKLHVVGTGLFTGLVSGITPVAAANFVTKAYVDGSGGGTGPFLPLAGGTMTGTNGVLMPDNFRLKIGTSEDLLIFHDGTDSQIFNQIGDLKIRNDQNDGDIVFMSDNGSGGVAEYFRLDGGAAETIFSRNTQHLDSVYAQFGTGKDLQIYHESSNISYIKHNASSDFRIQTSSTGYIKLMAELENMAVFIPNSAVELYFDNSKKLETTSTGVTVTGQLTVTNGIEMTAGNFNAGDGERIRLGNSADLQMFHDGSNSYIAQGGAGDLYIQQNVNDKDLVFQCDNGSGGTTTYFQLDGSHTQIYCLERHSLCGWY